MSETTKNHELKVWPPYFHDLLTGAKTFEIRKDDRNFQVGDFLILLEWKPDEERYTGNSAYFKITYKINEGLFGLKKGYCCLGITPQFKVVTNNKQL